MAADKPDATQFLTDHGFDFNDLEPQEVPVCGPERIKLPPGRYVLREASEAAAAAYRNAQSRAMTLDDDRRMKITGDLHDADTILLAGCLFQLTGPDGSTARAVGVNAVRAIPRRASEAMTAWAKRVSGMDVTPQQDKATGPADAPVTAGDDPKAETPPAGGTEPSGTVTS